MPKDGHYREWARKPTKIEIQPRLPTLFLCPKCGQQRLSVAVDHERKKVKAACPCFGSTILKYNAAYEPVDYAADLIDGKQQVPKGFVKPARHEWPRSIPAALFPKRIHPPTSPTKNPSRNLYAQLRKLVQCPYCSSAVRADRFDKHIQKAHKNEKPHEQAVDSKTAHATMNLGQDVQGSEIPNREPSHDANEIIPETRETRQILQQRILDIMKPGKRISREELLAKLGVGPRDLKNELSVLQASGRFTIDCRSEYCPSTDQATEWYTLEQCPTKATKERK